MTSCATIGVLTQPMVLHFYLRPRHSVASSDSLQSPRIATRVQLKAAHATDKEADKQPNKKKMKETAIQVTHKQNQNTNK